MSSAFVLLNTEAAAEEKVLDRLRRLENVSEAYVSFGVHDIIAKIETDSMDSTKKTISKIRRIQQIKSTVTLIICK